MGKVKMKNSMKVSMSLALVTTMVGSNVLVNINAIYALTSELNSKEEIVQQQETNNYSKLLVNEVYGGGGKSGKDGQLNAPYMYDFIEIYNPTNEDISLEGLTLRYTNSSGKTVQNYNFVEGQVIKANDYFLLRGETTLGNDGDKGHGLVFEADAYFDEPDKGIGMSDSKGNVEILKGKEVIDAVAFGKPDTFKGEGTSAVTLDIYSSAKRKDFQDTNDNSVDLEKVEPTPTKSGGEVVLSEVSKIQHIREDESLIGQTVIIEASVTGLNITSGNTTVAYVQDMSNAGIAIENLKDVKLGQKVKITGTVKVESNELRIEATESSIIDANENTVAPKVVKADEVKNYPAMYVKVTGNVTSKESDKLVINDALTVHLNDNFEVETGRNITLNGIVSIVNDDAFVMVRDNSEIKINAEGIKDTLSVEKIGGFNTGNISKDDGAAEIVKYNSDNNKMYLVNGINQTIDIISMDDVNGEEYKDLKAEKSINLAQVVEKNGFVYGDITSVDVNIKEKVVVASVQEADYTKAGKVVVMDYDGNIVSTYEVGIQPDMVKMTSDGKYIMTADEAEPRLGLANGQDPEGSISIIDYKTGDTKIVKFDDESVIASNVHIRNKKALNDLEPEYIAINDDNTKAYVSLQENNAIATIDIQSGKVLSVKSLSFKDHSVENAGLDAAKDNNIDIERLPILGAYMPDGISYVNIGGVDYIVTANEGDATEWKEFLNIDKFANVKNKITIENNIFKGMTKEEAQAKLNEMKNTNKYDSLEVLTDMGTDAIYTLGGRSFSIFNANTMEVVFDSGDDFEQITAQRFPEYFNANNKDVKIDYRSGKRGPEPEDVKIGKVGNRIYAFTGLERVGGVMTYDITNPANAKFVNYKNTRDYSADIAGDVAPEGLEFISAENSPNGYPMLLVANEVSGTVAINKIGNEKFTPGINPPVGDGTEEDNMQVTPDVNPSVEDESEDDTKPEVDFHPEDKEETESPKTSDTSIIGYVAGAILSVAGLGYVKLRNNRKNN